MHTSLTTPALPCLDSCAMLYSPESVGAKSDTPSRKSDAPSVHSQVASSSRRGTPSPVEEASSEKSGASHRSGTSIKSNGSDKSSTSLKSSASVRSATSRPKSNLSIINRKRLGQSIKLSMKSTMRAAKMEQKRKRNLSVGVSRKDTIPESTLDANASPMRNRKVVDVANQSSHTLSSGEAPKPPPPASEPTLGPASSDENIAFAVPPAPKAEPDVPAAPETPVPELAPTPMAGMPGKEPPPASETATQPPVISNTPDLDVGEGPNLRAFARATEHDNLTDNTFDLKPGPGAQPRKQPPVPTEPPPPLDAPEFDGDDGSKQPVSITDDGSMPGVVVAPGPGSIGVAKGPTLQLQQSDDADPRDAERDREYQEAMRKNQELEDKIADMKRRMKVAPVAELARASPSITESTDSGGLSAALQEKLDLAAERIKDLERRLHEDMLDSLDSRMAKRATLTARSADDSFQDGIGPPETSPRHMPTTAPEVPGELDLGPVRVFIYLRGAARTVQCCTLHSCAGGG